MDDLEVSHPASASRLSLMALVVVEASDFLAGVAAGSAGLLLFVERGLSAPPAEGVGVAVPLTEGGGSLGLYCELGLTISAIIIIPD